MPCVTFMQSLNEILESVDAPFEVTEGFIQAISLTVPWASLLQDNCALEVKGLEMVFRPRPRMSKLCGGYIIKNKFLKASTHLGLCCVVVSHHHLMYLFLASGTEPMYWSSFMTSSMQLAKECLSQRLTDDLGESFQPLEGLETFAETIETGTKFCSKCASECQPMHAQLKSHAINHILLL